MNIIKLFFMQDATDKDDGFSKYCIWYLKKLEQGPMSYKEARAELEQQSREIYKQRIELKGIK